MRTVLGLIAVGFGLASCHALPATSAPNARNAGRYSGVGVFDAGRAWAHIKKAAAPVNSDSATLEDDEHIIVVQDSITGEIRQCGDHSGYCLAMQPWRAEAARTPAALDKHLPQIAAEENENRSAVYDPSPAGGNGP